MGSITRGKYKERPAFGTNSASYLKLEVPGHRVRSRPVGEYNINNRGMASKVWWPQIDAYDKYLHVHSTESSIILVEKQCRRSATWKVRTTRRALTCMLYRRRALLLHILLPHYYNS